MPLTNAVHAVLFEGASARDALTGLMLREARPERGQDVRKPSLGAPPSLAASWPLGCPGDFFRHSRRLRIQFSRRVAALTQDSTANVSAGRAGLTVAIHAVASRIRMPK